MQDFYLGWSIFTVWYQYFYLSNGSEYFFHHWYQVSFLFVLSITLSGKIKNIQIWWNINLYYVDRV